jgi:hypothetical protein
MISLENYSYSLAIASRSVLLIVEVNLLYSPYWNIIRKHPAAKRAAHKEKLKKHKKERKVIKMKLK